MVLRDLEGTKWKHLLQQVLYSSLSDAMLKPLSRYTCIPNVPVFLPMPFKRFAVGLESRGVWFRQL